MKFEELKSKKDGELEKMLIDLKKELFNLRFQRVSGELTKTHRIRYIKKAVAKIKTLFNSKIRKVENA